ncbi:MAG: hypothetical protein SFW64_07465 [Alphaproteobacteria bacterium]|nr:hypothetical protein [Alphaproteobacteria bacterium]
MGWALIHRRRKGNCHEIVMHAEGWWDYTQGIVHDSGRNVMERPVSRQAEEYKGPGKAWSAFGGWGVGGILGRLAMIPFRWSAIKSIVNGKPIESIRNWYGANLFVLATSIVGAVIGWNKGKNGQEQFNESQTQLTIAEQENANLKQVITVQEENQKRFTEAFSSRKEHGTHAAAVEADKHQTHSAEPTI